MSIREVILSKLRRLPVEAGGIVITTDEQSIYYDLQDGSARINLCNNIVHLDNLEDITNILLPMPNKLYIDDSTGIGYMFINGKWKDIAGIKSTAKEIASLKEDRDILTKFKKGLQTSIQVLDQDGTLRLKNFRTYHMTISNDTVFELPVPLYKYGEIKVQIARNGGSIDIGCRYHKSTSEPLPEKGIFNLEYEYNPTINEWCYNITRIIATD